jgi:ATP-dependent exoDNAse (exonuclease V) alpha subunit
MNQKQALDTLKMGVNVFLTGAAGSGKTYVLNEYIKYLKKNGVNVAKTASTGIAATHMNGKTIHSWSHIGIKDSLTEADLNKIYSRTDFRMQIMAAQVLIIDEVSMLHDFRLDLVDQVLKRIHNNDLPFGGIQVVLCGDLFQLPPVSKFGEEARYVNQSEIWNNMDLHVCYLSEQYRQNDESFLKILNEIRADSISDESLELLSSRMHKTLQDKDSTKLFTHNVDVDSINQIELDKLKGKIHTFSMLTKGDQYVAKNLADNCLAPMELKLKVGAIVMFVQNNYKQGYVNGTIGRVIKFDRESGNPIVKTANGKKIVVSQASWRLEEGDYVVAEINQIPLRLAWAITIHKSQGMTLDYAEVDLSKAFTGGMGYVALSRVKSLDSLSLIGLNNNSLKVNPRVIEFDKQFKLASTETIKKIEKYSPSELKKIQKEFIYAYA